MKLNKFYFILGLIFISFTNHAQKAVIDSSDISSMPKPKFQWFQYNGYLKYMQTLGFTDLKTLSVDNLIHNRLNFKFYTPKGGDFTVQLRNRIHYGASVKNIDDFGRNTTSYNGVLPLEFLWTSNDGGGIVKDTLSVVSSTIIDRFFYTFSTEKFRLRIGRQRINWGINTTWNPNDIFNSYNIYDFDYEEREGADAISLKFFPNYLSEFDLSYKFSGDFDDDVFAIKYLFNKSNYDFQFLAGKFNTKIAAGFGWAGSIKSIGFKGEATFFQSYKGKSTQNLSASASFDYSWSNGFYIMAAYLYNSTGAIKLLDNPLSITQIPDAEHLMPSAQNALISANYQVSPIFSASLTSTYGFGVNSLSILPMLTVSVKQNLDLDFIGQLYFFQTTISNFSNRGNGIFWRLKFSF